MVGSRARRLHVVEPSPDRHSAGDTEPQLDGGAGEQEPQSESETGRRPCRHAGWMGAGASRVIATEVPLQKRNGS
jgi:hypothetical protein